jgi:hypothetical protein
VERWLGRDGILGTEQGENAIEHCRGCFIGNPVQPTLQTFVIPPDQEIGLRIFLMLIGTKGECDQPPVIGVALEDDVLQEVGNVKWRVTQ